jgi:hypothetical protein
MGKLAPVCDEQRLETLRAVMRYGIGVNHLASVLELQSRGFRSATPEEWEKYVGAQARRDLGQFGKEELVVGYVCTQMAWLFPDLPRERSGLWAGKRMDASALPEVVSRFRSLHGAREFLP